MATWGTPIPVQFRAGERYAFVLQNRGSSATDLQAWLRANGFPDAQVWTCKPQLFGRYCETDPPLPADWPEAPDARVDDLPSFGIYRARAVGTWHGPDPYVLNGAVLSGPGGQPVWFDQVWIDLDTPPGPTPPPPPEPPPPPAPPAPGSGAAAPSRAPALAAAGLLLGALAGVSAAAVSRARRRR